MVKFCCRGESLCGVATGTIRSERFLVVIVVAVQTISAHTQPGIFPLSDFPVGYIVGLVAFTAVGLFVGTGQLKAREIVIKFIFVKMQHVELATVVITVAIETFLVAHLPRCMIPPPGIHQRFDLFVAIQTLLAGHLVTQGVTLRAIGQALQVSVWLRQISR